MNNIEILKEFIDDLKPNLLITQAIKNVIQENKELKEENNKLKTCDGIFDVFRAGKESSRQRIEFDYIPKSKVKEKIEEIKLKNEQDCIALHGFQREAQIDILQELLEKGE